MTEFFVFSLLTMFTITVSENPVNDLRTHTLYLVTSAVNSLPLRRRISPGRKLKESVIFPGELVKSSNEVVLRIKHVALDFERDFSGKMGVVPGSRIIGKIPSPADVEDTRRGYTSHDKLLVFPYSACWVQGAANPCENCVKVMQHDVSNYDVHRKYRCLHTLQYGVTLDGGLQDYIKVRLPEQALVKVPRTVSLHDSCFLFDIALPFYAYCRDTLCGVLDKTPDCRILVILNDSAREANDCLLVIHHLKLEHLLITFTDMRKMNEVPGLQKTYANKFHHVLVFAPGQNALSAALSLCLATGLEATKDRHTIGLFNHDKTSVHENPLDRTFHHVSLSYKDKFLYQELLHTLAGFSHTEHDGSAPSISGMRSVDSAETSTNHLMLSDLADDQDAWASPAKKKKTRFKESGDVVSVSRTRSHILWLHCDRDYKLCLDDHCDHDTLRRCHLTSDMNQMIQSGKMQRVFYTNRPGGHVKINAFIF